MDTDLLLVIGITVFVLSLPTLLSAWVEGRVPRAGAIMVLVGGVLVVTALSNHGRGYTFSEIPEVFFSVIGRYIN
jgi:hypothetical protein